MKEDRRIKCKESEKVVGIGRRALMKIMHDRLNLSKLCAWWVPQLLTREQKEIRAVNCLELMHEFDDDPIGFHRSIVTGDETWIYWYDPETKDMPKKWRVKGGPSPVKAKVVKSAGKTMMTLFF